VALNDFVCAHAPLRNYSLTHPLTHSLTHSLTWEVSQTCEKYAKSFSSYEAHRAALISVSIALSQTLVYTVRPQMQG